MTFPVITKRNQDPPAVSTASSVVIATFRPVSSSTSRAPASTIVSPGSMRPAGRYHLPAQDCFASCIISTSLASFTITQATTTSRAPASTIVSPGSMRPAGRYHLPAQDCFASCIISTSLASFTITQATTGAQGCYVTTNSFRHTCPTPLA
uniref:Uncharacterized protein n=1 Tax=Anopheles atroparvus TaxID=41427 RepID=A0A182JN23_ANOAO